MTWQTLMIEKVPVGPTRYRDVVLTSWDRRLSHDYVVNGQGDDLPVLNRKCYKPSTREAIIKPI